MAKRRRRKRKGRVLSRPRLISSQEQDVGPTPETLAKLKPDPLLQLYDDGLIDHAGLLAADEIAMIYSVICRSLMVQAMPLAHYVAGRYEMPDEVAKVYRDNFLPWRASEQPQTAEMVIRVVVYREAVGSASERREVASSLARYARGVM